MNTADRAALWINENTVCSATQIAPDICTGERVWKFSRPSGKVDKYAPFIHRYVCDGDLIMLARDRGFHPWKKPRSKQW